MRSRALSALLALALAATSAGRARADDVAEARADYDAGAAAYDRHEYDLAAARLARADERVPNARALMLAMAAALQASDPGLAMELADRAERRAHDRATGDLAKKLRARFEARAGRLRFACAAPACEVEIDGVEVDATRPRWVRPGTHAVVIVRGELRETREVDVAAGTVVDIDADGRAALAEAPPAPPVPERGLPRAVLWSSIALTGVSAAAATMLTVDLVRRHDAFVESPSAQAARDGDAAQTRTRVAWGITGVLAIATVIVGLETDFAERGSTALRVDVDPSGVRVAGRFH